MGLTKDYTYKKVKVEIGDLNRPGSRGGSNLVRKDGAHAHSTEVPR